MPFEWLENSCTRRLSSSTDCKEDVDSVRCSHDTDFVPGKPSVMFSVVLLRLIFWHDREIRLIQIDFSWQNDILLAVRKNGKDLGNPVFSRRFRVSVVSGWTGKGMELEKVNHVFDPFGYGNLVCIKHSSSKRGKRPTAVKATVSSCSIAVVTWFFEMCPSAVRTAFDWKAVDKAELSRRRPSVLGNVPFVFRTIVKGVKIQKTSSWKAFAVVISFHMWWFGIRWVNKTEPPQFLASCWLTEFPNC